MTKECITHHFACDCRERKFAELERENAALRADRDRLDWLCEDNGSVWLYNYLRVTRCLCRKDIDSARKEAQP